MKVLTGFAVITDSVGKRIAYTSTTLDENGTITESNNKDSYVVLDQETLDLINALEEKIKSKFEVI